MVWKSVPQTRSLLTSMPRVDLLERTFAFRVFALNAVYPSDYEVSPRWTEAVLPTEAGRTLLDISDDVRGKFSEADLILALFGKFYHHDLLIDHQRTDLDAVKALLDDDLFRVRMRWPYRFGRLLYDKFNDRESESTEHLEPGQVAGLLDGTPQGVYQVGALLSGPLGFLPSRESRFLPPTLDLPLWHCSDTGCHALHQVSLTPPRNSLIEAFESIDHIALQRLGPPSEWGSVLRRLHRRPEWVKGKPYYDLPVLIAETILGTDRTTLLARALASKSGQLIRDTIAQPPRQRRLAQGSPDDLALRFSETEQLQLLLVLQDRELVTLLDTLLTSRAIYVPAVERRRANTVPRSLGNFDSRAELSMLGVRRQPDNALLGLAATIWTAYESTGHLEELGWRTRKRVGAPPKSTLIEFLRTLSPRDAVRELILSSMPITLKIAADVDFTIAGDDKNESIIDRLLWKLGFDVPSYDDELPRFANRLAAFREALLRTGVIRTEDDREQIRSIGVNLFVSVESLLEQLIAFNVWLLWSDHFMNTRFRYERIAAIGAVPDALGRDILSGDQTLSWDTTGGNTLGALLGYLDRAVKWMRELSTRERKELMRPSSDLPHYAGDPIRVFPFAHQQLWADADPSELTGFVEGFEAIANQILRANVAMVRNGLDHKRDEKSFPALDEMLVCVTRLQEAFTLADVNRYFPKPHWLHQRTADEYGRIEFLLRDYAGRPLLLYGPSIVRGNPRPAFRRAVVCPATNLLGEPNAELVFVKVERSPYSDYWGGYPRRRRIPAPTAGTHEPATDLETEDDRE